MYTEKVFAGVRAGAERLRGTSETHNLPRREEVPEGFQLPYRDELVDGLPLRRFLFPAGLVDPARAVVCVPGLAASGRSFARQAPLAQRWDLRPLTGPLAMPFPGNPIDSLARVVRGYMEGLDRPVLLGTSFGSLVALSIALELGQRISGLVLTAALASGMMVPRRYAAFAGAVMAPRPLAWLAAPMAARIMGGPDLDEEGRTELIRESRLLDSAEMFRRVTAVLSADLTALLPQIRVPILLVHGTRDHVIPLRAARRLAEAMPHGRYYEIEGAGHVPYLSHPERFNQLLGGFLEAVMD